MLRSKLLLQKENPGVYEWHPRCIIGIDKTSLVGSTVLKNLSDDKDIFTFQKPLTIDEDGGIVFNGDQTASAELKPNISNYTILVHANIDITKGENDIVGSGSTTTSDFLLMCFNNRIRAHQWPSSGGVLSLDSKLPVGQFVGQIVSGVDSTTLGVIQEKKIELVSTTVQSRLSAKPTIVLCGRAGNYGSGFFRGSIYGMRFYDVALTQSEIKREFENMQLRRKA